MTYSENPDDYETTVLQSGTQPPVTEIWDAEDKIGALVGTPTKAEIAAFLVGRNWGYRRGEIAGRVRIQHEFRKLLETA